METVEICVDSDLLKQVRLVLRPYGLTPEDAIVLFFKYCVNPETQQEAIELLLKWKKEQEIPTLLHSAFDPP